jgi:hypothetical protein
MIKNIDMKRIKYLILTILVITSFSCEDDFLKKNPLSFLSPENTYGDAAGLQATLDRAIRGIYDQINGDIECLMFQQNTSDNSVVSVIVARPNEGFIDARTHVTPQSAAQSQTMRATTFYRTCYINLKNTNTVIDYIDNVEWAGGESDPERNHILGTAYFLRALLYMQQTMQFGNCAFPLKSVTSARQDFKVFHMQGIWDQMIVDLEFAVQHMKTKNDIVIGRPPQAAARILLAKYYMLNQQYADAEAQMDAVINGGVYDLVTDADVDQETVLIGNNINPLEGNVMPGRDCNVPADAINYLHQEWNANRVKNNEGIWMLTNEWGYEDNSLGRSQQVRAYGANFSTTKFGVQTPDGQKGINTKQGRGEMMMKWGRGQGFARPTNYTQYEVWQFKGQMDTVDYRHKPGNWFDMSYVLYDNPDLEGTEWYLKPLRLYKDPTLPLPERMSFDNVLCDDTIRNWFGYPIYKFWVYDNDRPERQDGGQADMYILRLAEAYLIRAEAKFWQGDYQGCADDINVIRQRANALNMYTAGDVQTAGIGAVLDERNRELYGEEYRHDELVRISVIMAKKNHTDYMGNSYTWDGIDMEKSLSENSFYYNRMMDKNNFFRDGVTGPVENSTRYTIDPMHIFWPIYEPYIVGNVNNVLNQTTGYEGSEKNVEPLTHVLQPAGVPNTDPMVAIGEREE